jgi:hypothetical protein
MLILKFLKRIFVNKLYCQYIIEFILKNYKSKSNMGFFYDSNPLIRKSSFKK